MRTWLVDAYDHLLWQAPSHCRSACFEWLQGIASNLVKYAPQISGDPHHRRVRVCRVLLGVYLSQSPKQAVLGAWRGSIPMDVGSHKLIQLNPILELPIPSRRKGCQGVRYERTEGPFLCFRMAIYQIRQDSHVVYHRLGPNMDGLRQSNSCR